MESASLSTERKNSFDYYDHEPEDPRPDDDVLSLFVDSRPSITGVSEKKVVKVVLTGGKALERYVRI